MVRSGEYRDRNFMNRIPIVVPGGVRSKLEPLLASLMKRDCVHPEEKEGFSAKLQQRYESPSTLTDDQFDAPECAAVCSPPRFFGATQTATGVAESSDTPSSFTDDFHNPYPNATSRSSNCPSSIISPRAPFFWRSHPKARNLSVANDTRENTTNLDIIPLYADNRVNSFNAVTQIAFTENHTNHDGIESSYKNNAVITPDKHDDQNNLVTTKSSLSSMETDTTSSDLPSSVSQEEANKISSNYNERRQDKNTNNNDSPLGILPLCLEPVSSIAKTVSNVSSSNSIVTTDSSILTPPLRKDDTHSKIKGPKKQREVWCIKPGTSNALTTTTDDEVPEDFSPDVIVPDNNFFVKSKQGKDKRVYSSPEDVAYPLPPLSVTESWVSFSAFPPPTFDRN